MLKRFRKNKKGFTLIELVVVIAILGVLAVLVVPNVVNRVKDAEDTVKETNAKLLQKALDMYLIDLEGATPTAPSGSSYTADELKALLVPGYLDEIPELDGITVIYDSDNNRFIVTTDSGGSGGSGGSSGGGN